MVDISIDSIVRIRLSEIEEYELDEDDDDDDDTEPFYRTLLIETASGTIEIELNATTEDALEILDEDEG